jgi:NAD(P)-dependent dehydrogenase (short-subunit alcohol dehydrogenase family)
VNVTGTMLTLRAFAPRLTTGSAVTTIASVVALAGFPKRDAYTASKGAIVALSRAWAADLIGHGIRVNCVCPGVTSTPMATTVTDVEHPDLPLGRPATPAEVAEVIVAISEPAASYLSGAIVPVDGGLTAAARTARITRR